MNELIDTKDFFDTLRQNGLTFFTGVPDSLLQSFCACVAEHCDADTAITAANEGNAVGIACGYHLATGKAAVVYMQNSGIGNAVNPLVSLADEEVYSIPMLLLVGWRGEPGIPDEPQHIKQGKITPALLETLGIRTLVLEDDYAAQIRYCAEYMQHNSKPIAVIVRKNTFSPYTAAAAQTEYSLTRERALQLITEQLSAEDIVVSTTGKTSRELFELREHSNMGHGNDFLTVGSMGHTSSIGLGLSLFTQRNVYCIDGDGSFLMHMGAAAVNAFHMRENFRYIIINNGAHESVGGQATVGFEIHIPQILKGCGFPHVCTASDEREVVQGMAYLKEHPRSAMVICVKQGARSDLGRPTVSPIENKKMLMENIVE